MPARLLGALVVLTALGGCKKSPARAPLGDKSAACDKIYQAYSSHQDKQVWRDACMAAPDENVRCVSLIMDEGKDDACMKLVNSRPRTRLVKVLNGTPGQGALAPTPVIEVPEAAEGDAGPDAAP